MTRIHGSNAYEAECCGRQYATVNFLSMNFSCDEYWTDGWRENSLMPNWHGLWQCGCGEYHFGYERMQLVYWCEDSDLPRMGSVTDHQLPHCIELVSGTPLESHARQAYWQSLNHGYRGAFYALREEMQLTAQRDKFDWHLANPDTRNWWQKLRGKPAPVYPHAAKPIPMPAFTPSQRQVENMQRLCALLTADSAADPLTLAEVQRQLGQYSNAHLTLQRVPEKQRDRMYTLIQQLVEAGNPAPRWISGR